MDRNYGTTGDYMYPGYGEDSNSTENNNPSMSGDILQNFPYLRHGFNLSSQPSSSASTQDSLRNSLSYKSSGFQQGFSQMPGGHLSSLGNSSPFQSYIGAPQMPQNVLPSVSTFTSALPHSALPSNFPLSISNTGDSSGHDTSSYTQKTYRYPSSIGGQSSSQSNSYLASQVSPLPGFQSLTSSASTENQQRAIYSSRFESSTLHGSSSEIAVSKSVEHFNDAPMTIQSSDYGSNTSASTNFQAESVAASSNFYNLVNHAVKMEPVHIPYKNQEKQRRRASSAEKLVNRKNNPQIVESRRMHPEQKRETTNVRFFLKGRLSNRKTNTDDRLIEKTDVVATGGVSRVSGSKTPSNIVKVSKSKPSGNPALPVTPKRVYKEPSLADIRASVANFGKDKESDDQLANVSTDSIKEELEDNSDENMKGFSLGGDGSMHEAWYNATIKKYAHVTNEEDMNSPEMAVKKGGRSDPENPFAITSPSFSASAARALMTTTNTSTATTVRISIMSIGSRKKLMTSIVNSQAAQGGIVSVVNPINTDTGSLSEFTSDGEVKSEKTSIMSKLKRDRQDKKDQQEDDMDTEIDRLDIDIKIDDDQYVGEGSQKRWQCKICPKSYTTKHNLLAHILDHSSIKPHLCLVCGKYFKQLSHLNTHMLTHDHVKPYKCSQCGKGFTQISHLKRHETVHLESKPYICDICNRGFAYPSELRIHKDKHIFGKEKCTDCDKEFNTIDELKDHMAQEKHGDDLTCKHCRRVFKYPSQLRDHMMSHGGPRPYICTECGMDFMKEHHLKAHLFTHTGLRPYSCPHCHRAFNQKANMVRHMLIHDSDRAFKCEICSKTFTQPQTLKAHMVVHSDKKPYSCRYCGKQFGRQHNLQGHLHMHMDSKPYICSICQSSFTLKGNLNRHKKVKHGLNESTENMEEDAVNFLSSLSDRARDSGSTDQDQDPSSHDEMASDSKGIKKARKSIPKKRITQMVYGEGGQETGSNTNKKETEEDPSKSNPISYSDEERENEERISKFFSKEEEEVENEGTKRKPRRAVMLQNTENNVYDEDTENEPEDESETEDESEADEFLNAMNGGQRMGDGESEHLKGAVQEKRSLRKRKKKELDEDFLGGDEVLDDDDEYSEPLQKNARRKGAKLDTIIASKFKNV